MKASQLRELIRELIQGHLDEMSTTGALVQPGGQQIATTKAFTSMRDWKKINKNRKWESINEIITHEYEERLNWVVDSYFNGDPKVKEAAKEYASIKAARTMGGRYHTDSLFKDFHNKYNPTIAHQAMEALDMADDDAMFSESINESYRKFKKKITNPRQQMNNSVREIEKHLREVDKIIEYNLKLKTEMNVGGGTFYEGTNKRLARISERMNQLNNKLKELGN